MARDAGAPTSRDNVAVRGEYLPTNNIFSFLERTGGASSRHTYQAQGTTSQDRPARGESVASSVTLGRSESVASSVASSVTLGRGQQGRSRSPSPSVNPNRSGLDDMGSLPRRQSAPDASNVSTNHLAVKKPVSSDARQLPFSKEVLDSHFGTKGQPGTRRLLQAARQRQEDEAARVRWESGHRPPPVRPPPVRPAPYERSSETPGGPVSRDLFDVRRHFTAASSKSRFTVKSNSSDSEEE